MGIVDPAEPGTEVGPQAAMIPLTRTSWLTLSDEATLSSESTEALARRGTLLPALRWFHVVAFALERLNRRLAVFDEASQASHRVGVAPLPDGIAANYSVAW